VSLPLDGLVVADFSRVLAGPLATATLADLGARVIKVERPDGGDDTRAWGPPWVGESGGTTSYFESCNRNKESVVLDLGQPGDQVLARELALRADVLVENFRTGTLDKFGLGYDQLREHNPGLVYASLTGFGSRGGAALAGYDFLVQAVGGLMSVTGVPDSHGGTPTKVGVALVDVLTSKDLTSGILAALHARHASGLGQRLEVNLLSSLLASMANQTSAYLTTGESPGRMGNAHPSIAPYELLRCADGMLAVACGNDTQFRRLAGVLDGPELADDPRYVSNGARVANRATLVTKLERLLAPAAVDHWVKLLSDVGVPAGKVGNIGDGFALARELGLDPTVDVGEGRPPQVRHPVTYSRTPVTTYVAPPQLGQHSDEIRRWLQEEENK
jgi:crotonobetainyl-CoA:carnitine CoA-transferase CaiB-like acyl-CoA transferase